MLIRIEVCMKNIIVVFLTIAVLVLAGAGILGMRISSDAEKVSSYNQYVASARERAQKGIVYYARADYLKAFSIYQGDQGLLQEFLDFLETTEYTADYKKYLQTYIRRYPEDTQGYERLCRYYYDNGSYRDVQLLTAEAEAAGIVSEALAEYKDKVNYEFVNLGGGYESVSPFYGRQAIVGKGGLKGLYYLGSGVTIPIEYRELSFYVNGAMAAKNEAGECYFMDFAGNKSGVTDKPVDSLSYLGNGYSVVSVDGGYSYTTSALTVPEQLPYEYATPFSGGVAAVKKDGKWGLIDTNADYIVAPSYDDIVLNEFGSCVSGGVIFARQGETYHMLDAQGNRLNTYDFEQVYPFQMSGQPAAVKLDGKWTFVKNTGELYELEGREFFEVKSFNNFLAPATRDGENWGYIDAYGNFVIEPQWADCLQFSEYGAAPVYNGTSWSFIQLIRYK